MKRIALFLLVFAVLFVMAEWLLVPLLMRLEGIKC